MYFSFRTRAPHPQEWEFGRGNSVCCAGADAVCRFSLFRILLGDFDVRLMHHTNPVLAPMFFFLFIFFVFFVMLYVFLAVINQAYLTVKDASGKNAEELSLSTYLFAVISSAAFGPSCSIEIG